jgi:KDO2-lipid IV(A) lauroyltransferase
MALVGDFLAYLALRAALVPFQVLPIRAARALGKALGLIVYYLAPIRKAVVRRNIAAFFPEWEPARRDRLVRDAYVGLGLAAADFAVGTRFRPGNVERFIRLEGAEHYRAAHAAGGQVILFGAHQSMWEWAQCVKHWTGGDSVYAIGKRIHNRFIDAFVKRKRNVFGVEMLSQRGAIASLTARGKSDPTANYAFFVDQRAAKHKGVWVNVAGHPVAAMPGPAILALRGDLPLIPAQFIRTECGMILRFHPPLYPQRTGDEAADIQRLTQQISDHVTSWVRAYPESYFWVHDRFKLHAGEAPAPAARADRTWQIADSLRAESPTAR